MPYFLFILQKDSLVVFGYIARDELNLFITLQSPDQKLTSRDEITFSFTKDLQCQHIDASFIKENISMMHTTAYDTIPFNVSCYANKLIFTTAQPMSNYDGHFLRTQEKSKV